MSNTSSVTLKQKNNKVPKVKIRFPSPTLLPNLCYAFGLFFDAVFEPIKTTINVLFYNDAYKIVSSDGLKEILKIKSMSTPDVAALLAVGASS